MERELAWIHVRGLRLWAHVGVLDVEQTQGQWFELDLCLGLDASVACRSDNLADTLDYSLVITALQSQARLLRCRTIEHYSEQMLELIDQLYGAVPTQLELRKCRAPVAGFAGVVAIQRQRHWPQESPWANHGLTGAP